MAKVSFNGTNKTITVLSAYADIAVKEDLYSEWKIWAASNPQYLPAIRCIGGDPIGGGKFAGDIYFLMNGWQVIVDHEVTVTGTLYHDDGIEPFVLTAGGAVRSVVSSLVQSVSSSGYTIEQIAAAMEPMLTEIKKKVEETQAFVLSS